MTFETVHNYHKNSNRTRIVEGLKLVLNNNEETMHSLNETITEIVNLGWNPWEKLWDYTLDCLIHFMGDPDTNINDKIIFCSHDVVR